MPPLANLGLIPSISLTLSSSANSACRGRRLGRGEGRGEARWGYTVNAEFCGTRTFPPGAWTSTRGGGVECALPIRLGQCGVWDCGWCLTKKKKGRCGSGHVLESKQSSEEKRVLSLPSRQHSKFASPYCGACQVARCKLVARSLVARVLKWWDSVVRDSPLEGTLKLEYEEEKAEIVEEEMWERKG
jgi:hypothetical protein